jgi:hypothetical protein
MHRINSQRKTRRRLPNIPPTVESPYELSPHYPEEFGYIDPDYQTVDEINVGYDRLIGRRNDTEDDNGTMDDDTGSYVQPNDVIVHLEDAKVIDEDDGDRHHSYLEIIESPEKAAITKNEFNHIRELVLNKCDNEKSSEHEMNTANVTCEISHSDINKQ